MHLGIVFKILGLLVLGLAVVGVLPLATAILAGDACGPWPWLGMILAALAFGGILVALGRTASPHDLGLREGIAVTSLVWVMASLVAGLGIDLAVPEVGFIAAWFEAMSGFTTTGSTVFGGVVAIADLDLSVLLWRALSQWMGGIGIVVISLALLPLLTGGQGFQLYRAEVPGLSADRLAPRIIDSARLLVGFYGGLTVAVGLGLRACGVGGFDALCHAMTTVSTGGFSTYDTSIEGLGSAAAEWVVIAGMLLAGMNFGLLLAALSGRFDRLLGSVEIRTYGVLLGGASIILIAVLAVDGRFYAGSLHDLIRDSLFQAVTIATSTGYATGYEPTPGGIGWEAWPPAAQFLLVLLMVVGGCTGSTAGGTKIIRWVVAWRAARREMLRYAEPARVVPIRIDGHPLRDAVALQVGAFLALFAATWAVGALLLTLLGHDMATAGSVSLTCLSNIGPGLGEVAVSRNFHDLGSAAHVLCIFLMLVGRLEFIGVLLLLSPRQWTR